jgi:hypothetical protein
MLRRSPNARATLSVRLMHSSFSNWLRRAVVLGFVFSTFHAAHAQATTTASRTNAVTPFAQMTVLRPDWGPNNNYGYTFGVDYTHFIRFRVQPSFELRATSANGTAVNEHSYLGGFQLQTRFHGIYPYVTFLGGYGQIHYNYYNGGFTGDHSMIYSLGGGGDIPIARSFSLRLDYARQSWNIAPQKVNPVSLSAGIAYTLGGDRRGRGR